jgi:hypothetical protein
MSQSFAMKCADVVLESATSKLTWLGEKRNHAFVPSTTTVRIDHVGVIKSRSLEKLY